MAGRTRVFIACSLDGFIAGPDDDLSWLPTSDGADDYGYGAFIADVGALLMGRRTYEVVIGFPGEWSFGERPVLVATSRALSSAQPTVRAVAGPVATLVEDAHTAAGGRDVYLDGGNLIRQALDAGLIDEITITVVPVVLGQGLPLFSGCAQRHALDCVRVHQASGGLVQITYHPRR